MLRTGPDYDASGSTRDIHELQAALQAAQLTATDTGTKYSGIHGRKCLHGKIFVSLINGPYLCLN